jgi:hypothetical protein
MALWTLVTTPPDAPTYTVAGFVAGHPWTPPGGPPIDTVSDCLADLLPAGPDPLAGPWHRTLDAAAEAARGAPGARVLAMSVPATAPLVRLLDRSGGHPAPIRANLARPGPPPTERVGFEVLGFEHGAFHSWHCYGIDEQAVNLLGVRAGEDGLLVALADAHRVAEMANGLRGTPDGTPLEVTWFPALISGVPGP